MPEFDLSLLLYGLAIGLGAGMLGGLMAGLAGVGGGLIYVPVFYALMPGHDDGMGTYIFASLVAIIITGFFSSRSHWRLGHIDKPSLALLLPGLIIGAALGLWSTLHIPGIWILVALAALNAWVAFDYHRPLLPNPQGKPPLALCSGPIGYLSGLLGIGGGTMLVPLLRRSLILRQAVGTSAVCGLLMAGAAIGINISLESHWYQILATEWLFLCGTWLGIMIILPYSAPYAARLHDSIPETMLRMLLKAMFMLLSCAFLIAAMLAAYAL